MYSRAQQRVWAVEADGTVVKTHLVSGRRFEPYAGTYHVYSRSMYTYSTANPTIKWRYMVRFAYGPGGGRIGFHEIPNRNGVPLQSERQLGQPLSGGCVRQSTRRRRVDVELGRRRHQGRRPLTPSTSARESTAAPTLDGGMA